LIFIYLFICLFSGQVLVNPEDGVFFITRPKHKEIFVGEDVQFDWEYARTDVQEVSFGVILPDIGEMTIYSKKKDGGTVFNNAYQAIDWIRDRTEIVSNRRASFKINRVQMKDTGTYYCTLVVELVHYISTVRLTVVDLLIDKQLSTQTKETWEGHKITILCAVRLPPGQTGVKFSWMHIPSNRTVSKQFHEELRGKSYLTITTIKDEDFESLQCRAETASTVKFHVIDIIKLNAPSEPRNLKAERSLDNKIQRTYIRLSWDPPADDGGAALNYIISYKQCGLLGKSPKTLEAETSEFMELFLPGGSSYRVTVKAKNKAGIGPPSNKLVVNLGRY
ncbi:unnamed protein product, partial [Porites evermanni]